MTTITILLITTVVQSETDDENVIIVRRWLNYGDRVQGNLNFVS